MISMNPLTKPLASGHIGSKNTSTMSKLHAIHECKFGTTM